MISGCIIIVVVVVIIIVIIIIIIIITIMRVNCIATFSRLKVFYDSKNSVQCNNL